MRQATTGPRIPLRPHYLHFACTAGIMLA
jgi:hypothetical protein